MTKKNIKVIKHYPYSLKTILPKDFCRALGITENTILTCEIDLKNQSLILKKKKKEKFKNE